MTSQITSQVHLVETPTGKHHLLENHSIDSILHAIAWLDKERNRWRNRKKKPVYNPTGNPRGRPATKKDSEDLPEDILPSE